MIEDVLLSRNVNSMEDTSLAPPTRDDTELSHGPLLGFCFVEEKPLAIASLQLPPPPLMSSVRKRAGMGLIACLHANRVRYCAG